MGFLVRLVVLYVPLLAVAGAGLALVYGIEDRPAVATRADLSVADIARGRILAERFDPRRLPPGRATRITLSAAELDAVLDAAMAASDAVRAKAALRPYGLVLAATVTLPARLGPLGRYLNLRAAVPPSRDGFEIARLAVGRIEIPGGLVKPALRFALDRLLGPGEGRPVVDSIRAVSFGAGRMTVVYRPPAQAVEKMKAAALRAVRAANPEKVARYYEAIRTAAQVLPRRGRVSLAAFVGPVFDLAKERSLTHDAVAENRAALLALAVYFGDRRLARLAGPEVARAVAAHPPPSETRARLAGRADWVQHFIVSAALGLAGGRQVAELIGVAKEVDDITHSSGFSFTDLAADRAGTRLARTAVASPAGARRVQARLAGRIVEGVFFPEVRDLPEMMSGAAFRARYGGIHDARYIRMVVEIDRRIDGLPLYR